MSAITGKEWLVTCDKCCQKLLHQGRKFSLDSIRSCGQCASFLNSKIQFHPSDSFPSEGIPVTTQNQIDKNTPFLLEPSKITFESMVNACFVAYSHHKLLRNDDNHWNKEKSKAYLQKHCVNSKLQDYVLQCATNYRDYERTRNHKNTNLEFWKELELEFHNNQQNYFLQNLPTIWKLRPQFDIQDFSPALGHQLFLGVTRLLFVHSIAAYMDRQKIIKPFSAVFDSIISKIYLRKLDFFLKLQTSAAHLIPC